MMRGPDAHASGPTASDHESARTAPAIAYPRAPCAWSAGAITAETASDTPRISAGQGMSNAAGTTVEMKRIAEKSSHTTASTSARSGARSRCSRNVRAGGVMRRRG